MIQEGLEIEKKRVKLDDVKRKGYYFLDAVGLRVSVYCSIVKDAYDYVNKTISNVPYIVKYYFVSLRNGTLYPIIIRIDNRVDRRILIARGLASVTVVSFYMLKMTLKLFATKFFMSLLMFIGSLCSIYFFMKEFHDMDLDLSRLFGNVGFDLGYVFISIAIYFTIISYLGYEKSKHFLGISYYYNRFLHSILKIEKKDCNKGYDSVSLPPQSPSDGGDGMG